MTSYEDDYINYRLVKAQESLDDAKLLANNGSWNACINRLYYTCFYAVSALLLQRKIDAKTHTGQKTQFGLNFVKTGLVSLEQGKLYADLMDWRQKGDYGDMFDFDEESVAPLIEPVGSLFNKIKELIQNPSAE